MIHKKRTCLLSAKIGTDSLNYGKINTLKSIHRLLYSPLSLLLSTVNHHSSWSSSFICGDNGNGFVKGIQQEFFYWNSCRFCQGCNRKFYNPARIVTEMLSTCPLFTEGNVLSQDDVEIDKSNDVSRRRLGELKGIIKSTMFNSHGQTLEERHFPEMTDK
jgi:hypothetical protein